MKCFRPTPLWTKLSTVESGIRLAEYQPNLVTKQFGLSQFLPKFLTPSEDCMFISTANASEETLVQCLINFKKKSFDFPYFRFSLSFYYTKEFEDWWQSYYQSAADRTLMA